MIKVGIVGATGYTGVELLRLLVRHPDVEIACVTSRAEAGRPVADLYPSLRGQLDLRFVAPEDADLKGCDAVFFATPHGVAQAMLPDLIGRDLGAGPKIIDISADFRLRDRELWERWYNQQHACPELIEQAVYGLPELNREKIKSAQLVACPGCFPTVIQLGLIPLVEAGIVDSSRLIANAATGVSGGGRNAKVDFLFPEVSDSFKAYGIGGHRHQPEIEQMLAQVAPPGQQPSVTFIPHLAPMIRGIHATLYAPLLDNECDLQSLFETRYQDEPFVDVMPAGSTPPTSSVKTSNVCRLSVFKPKGSDLVVVLGVIDNLTKGASGQAVQCFNLMFGLDETTGINQLAVMP